MRKQAYRIYIKKIKKNGTIKRYRKCLIRRIVLHSERASYKLDNISASIRRRRRKRARYRRVEKERRGKLKTTHEEHEECILTRQRKAKREENEEGGKRETLQTRSEKETRILEAYVPCTVASITMVAMLSQFLKKASHRVFR